MFEMRASRVRVMGGGIGGRDWGLLLCCVIYPIVAFYQADLLGVIERCLRDFLWIYEGILPL